MRNIRVWKSIGAVVVALALLTGVFAATGMLFGQAEIVEAPPEKFVADFSELVALGGDAVTSDGYATAYTPSTDTTSVDGKLNNWMRERFATKTNFTYSTYRSWFGQLSDEISDKEGDIAWGYNGHETGFRVHPDGLMQRVVGVYATEMLRRVDTIIPQFNGENVQLKNFKMTIKYRTRLQNYRGAIVVGFDETDAGKNIDHTEPVYAGYRRLVTGSTLVLGNGNGRETRNPEDTTTFGAAANDGWVFYNRTEVISSTTVDNQNNTGLWPDLDLGETEGDYTVANGNVMYKRFDTDSTDQWLILTVEVKNGKAIFTTTSEDGYRDEMMEMDYDPRGGFVSIGMSDRDYIINYVDIEEYDDEGNAIDFGTYHNKTNYDIDAAVEVFSADFADVPDLHYVNGQYLYNVNHDPSTGKYVGLTETGSTTLTGVAAASFNYDVNVKDKALVDYLESKFDFYVTAEAVDSFQKWNAAGYVVDAEGNNVSAGWVANSVTGYIPATGIQGGDWLPGNGTKNAIYSHNSNYPLTRLEGNRWLVMQPEFGILPQPDPFQMTYYFQATHADGSNAVLKNFQLDLDFKLTHPDPSYANYAHNQPPVFVRFGGFNTVKRGGSAEGAMFAMSHNGGYFLDDLNTEVNGSTFMNTQNADKTPYYTTFVGNAAGDVKVEEAHLTLTVKNGTVRAVVTAADGTQLLDVTKNDINIQSGLIQIGTGSSGMPHGAPRLGAVSIVRLDNDGNPVDFSGDEDTFDASFVGLTDVIDACYYRNLGTKNNAITAGKVTQPWLTNAVSVASGYAFTAEDANIVNYLNDKFDFYHTDLTGKIHSMPTPYTTTEELQTDAWAPTAGRWILQNGRILRASLGAAYGELFRKSLTLVPKLDGEAVQAVDFKAEFDYSIESVRSGSYYPGGVALTFRSSQVAKTTSPAGGYEDAVTLVFTREKMVLYDNRAADYAYDDIQADEGGLAWNNSITDVGEAHVSVKAIGNTLSLKVTSADGTTVYYENNNITLSRPNSGYVYLTALDSDVAFGDISINPLYAENYTVAPTSLFARNGKILGLKEQYLYEYKEVNAEEWLPVEAGSTEITDLDMTLTYQVRFAATKCHSAGTPVTVEVITYDKENTVQYNFNDEAQLDNFTTWFVPTLTDGKGAINTTGTANTNWHITDGTLKYQGSDLWHEPTAYIPAENYEGVTIDGELWSCNYATVYNSNFGVAVLNTRKYKNFILDFDFTGSPYWTMVGFGAGNTADTVFWNTADSGYSMFLEDRDNGQGGWNYYYRTAEGLQTNASPTNVAYDTVGQHHMRVIVSDLFVHVSLDDQVVWSVQVSMTNEGLTSYFEGDGGYIYFGLNNTTTAIDNIQIVDLDAKPIEITGLARPIEPLEIDRAAGGSLHAPVVYGATADGYEYPLFMDLAANEDYRSYKDETFEFGLNLISLYGRSIHNVSFANDFAPSVSVVNKVDYNADTSRKYYFDHVNDLKDFQGYYSKYEERAEYWPNADDPGRNNYWSAFDGELLSMDGADRQWVISNNMLMTNYWGGNEGASPVGYMSNLSTLIYEDHQLMNFRMEYDVKMGAASWWYNYSLIGVQDPTKYPYKLYKRNTSYYDGSNTSNMTYDGTKDAGVYAFLEQEGYFNIFGNVQGGDRDRVDTDVVTLDGDAYEFIQNYDRNAWHHIVVEVVNGIMKWTVDDSFTLYYELDYNAYGGCVGLGTYGTYSQFDNFQITALDENGDTVNLDTAEQGVAKDKEVITKPSGWVPNDEFVWAN